MIHTLRHRASRVAAALVLVTAVLAMTAPAAFAKPLAFTKTVLVRIPGEIIIAAPPDAVWEVVTRDRGIMTLGGYSPTSMGPSRRFEKAGDVVPAAAGSDAGLLVVTRLDAEAHELRVAFEPQDGRYLCHTDVTLSAAAGGTRVAVVHRYSDEKPATADKTARQVAARVREQLAAFKTMVEGR